MQKDLSKNYIEFLTALKKDVEEYKKDIGGIDDNKRYADYKAQFNGGYDIFSLYQT